MKETSPAEAKLAETSGTGNNGVVPPEKFLLRSTGRKIPDLTGQTFGLWTVVGPAADRSFYDRAREAFQTVIYWKVKCACGRVEEHKSTHLVRGSSRSCGCDRAKDLRGQKFGRWTVGSRILDRRSSSGCSLVVYHCACDCGQIGEVAAKDLLSGHSQSCGCLRNELQTKHGYSSKGKKSSEYRIWVMIKQRTRNSRSKGYAKYGRRGITMCDRWYDSFEYFIADMGLRPSKRHSIDRIDNEHGNYEPGACRWATREEQARNKSNNHRIKIGQEEHCIKEWSEISGINHNTILARLRRGRLPEDAVFTRPDPRWQRHEVEFN